MVGRVAEPSVNIDKASLQFGRVLVGGKATQYVTLVNSEAAPFAFAFDAGPEAAELALLGARRASGGGASGRGAAGGDGSGGGGLKPGSAGGSARGAGGMGLSGKAARVEPILSFEPQSGTIPPGGKQVVAVTFAPTLERAVNFSAVCSVRKKATRLALNVKGEGFAVRASLSQEGAQPGLSTELVTGAANPLDLGQVLVHERATRRFTVTNGGDAPLDFVWDTSGHSAFSVTPPAGCVPAGEHMTCELLFAPVNSEKIDGARVLCSIINGHRFALRINALAHRPRLRTSWQAHDFGLCFTHHTASTSLRLSNEDAVPLNLTGLWEPLPWLSVSSPPPVLGPGESCELALTFMPREAAVFRTTLLIEVNGASTLKAVVSGDGVGCRVELADAAQAVIPFGALKAGSVVTKTVRLQNKSRLPAAVDFGPCLPLLSRLGVSVQPPSLVLRPKDGASFTLQFRPGARTRAFHEELVVDIGTGLSRALLAVTGACVGREVRLATDTLPFGTVVAGSRAVLRLQIENLGDVPQRFSWDAKAFAPFFAVAPAQGTLPPHSDASLEVTFHPAAPDPDIRKERLRCVIEGADDVFLTLSGASVTAEAQPAALSFSAPVRGVSSGQVTIANPTGELWALRPVVVGDAFSGPERLEVPGGGSATYPLAFKPGVMGEHRGSVFFPLPAGAAVLHTLLGNAGPPLPAGNITRSVVAKQQHTEVVHVHNWLRHAQRFQVEADCPGAERATRLSVVDHIDVPAGAERECRLQFYAFKEGATTGRLVFTNEQTKEYQFYDLSFNAAPPGTLAALRLQCQVRNRVTATVSIDNPLPEPVTFHAVCPHPQVVRERLPQSALPSTYSCCIISDIVQPKASL